MKIVHCFASALLLGALAATSQPTAAQTYPDRPITLVVPYPAGGGNDVLARLVAEKMSKPLGQSIVVENRGGAGGTIATRQVAKSPPDGYTLLIATSSLAINPSLPANSIAELIALAKKTPGKLDFASTGSGSSVHLAAELFASMAGVKLTHVPYRGTAPALTDLLGGHVRIMFATMPSALGLVRDGKVRALAVTGPQRSANFPELPTVAEAGLPGYEAVLHYGLVAAAGTPRPIVDKLNAALREALTDNTLRARVATEGAESSPSTPEEYATDIDH